MSQINSEVKTAIYTYVACKIARERQEEEINRNSRLWTTMVEEEEAISDSTQTSSSSRASLIDSENLMPLSTNFYDNLLIVYSQAHSITGTTSGTQLSTVTEEAEEEGTSTLTNETHERQELSEEAEEDKMRTPTNESYEQQGQTNVLQTVREPGIRTNTGRENRKTKRRNRRTQPYNPF
jgi:hypothetical protein